MSRPMHVLIVGDSPLISERLAEMVESLPSTVLDGIVETEAAARAELAHGDTDVAIVDIHLKAGSGFGVLRYLRDRKLDCVYEYTAHSAYRDAAMALGASYGLDKANDFERLTDLWRNLPLLQQDILRPPHFRALIDRRRLKSEAVAVTQPYA